MTSNQQQVPSIPLGESLRESIKATGLTIGEFSERTGVAQSTLYDLLRGTRRSTGVPAIPSGTVAQKIAAVLDEYGWEPELPSRPHARAVRLVEIGMRQPLVLAITDTLALLIEETERATLMRVGNALESLSSIQDDEELRERLGDIVKAFRKGDQSVMEQLLNSS